MPDRLQPAKPELPPEQLPEPEPEPEPLKELLPKPLPEPLPGLKPWPELGPGNKPEPKRELPVEPSVKPKLPAEPRLHGGLSRMPVPPLELRRKRENVSKPTYAVPIPLHLLQPEPGPELEPAEMADVPRKLLPKPGLCSRFPAN